MVNNIIMPSFERSTRKNKKYMTLYNGKIIHFGDLRYEQFEDKAAYRRRARGILDKDGSLSYLNMNSPNYYSYI